MCIYISVIAISFVVKTIYTITNGYYTQNRTVVIPYITQKCKPTRGYQGSCLYIEYFVGIRFYSSAYFVIIRKTQYINNRCFSLGRSSRFKDGRAYTQLYRSYKHTIRHKHIVNAQDSHLPGLPSNPDGYATITPLYICLRRLVLLL